MIYFAIINAIIQRGCIIMEIKEIFPNELEKIKEYYNEKLQDKECLTIIGLNDDRGFNIQKNILMYLRDALQSEKYDIQMMDAFSMFFNKTRHIDYYLTHNVTLEELMLMQQYGTENELKHVTGLNLPFLSGGSKVINDVLTTKLAKKGEISNLGISDLITSAIEPVFIYASGINDIMYSLHINPFNLKKAYLKREKCPKYDYAVAHVNKQTISDIIDGHKRNFENILGLNGTSDIYVLSAYLYTAMDKEYEKIFKEAILMYNDKLFDLCKEYNVTYINSRILEQTKFNNVLANYISKYPPYIIASEIIHEMYKKISYGREQNPKICSRPNVKNDGSLGVIEELQVDIDRVVKGALNSNGYQHQIYVEQLEEHRREKAVFEKVYQKLNR